MSGAGSLLITGCTGMAGRELTRHLLTRTNVSLTLLVHDTGQALSRARLLRELFRVVPTQPLIGRVRLVRGDLTKERLGLPGTIHAELASSVDGIIHAAATTRFDLPLAEARRVNVLATEHLVRFAKHCRNLARFGMLSTVFVSGRRRGRILESERVHTAGFVNTYEQSKYEGEELTFPGCPDFISPGFCPYLAVGTHGVWTRVPEPSTLVLLGVGLAGLVFYRRRRLT